MRKALLSLFSVPGGGLFLQMLPVEDNGNLTDGKSVVLPITNKQWQVLHAAGVRIIPQEPPTTITGSGIILS